MAEVTQELMFELMKRLHERFDRLDLALGEVRVELNAMRGQMVSIHQDVHNIYGVLGRHDQRLDRIERRLELRELAEGATPYDPAP